MAWNEPGGGKDNDPWGNRKKEGSGPPDLDEVMRNFRNQLNGLFGKRGRGPSRNNGSGGGGPKLPGGSLGARGFGIVVAIVGTLWLLTGIYMVQPAEAAVVTQFGRYVRTTDPGLHWAIPWPVQDVEKVNVAEVRTTVLPDQLMLTMDENIVSVDMGVQYNIKDAKDFLFKVQSPDQTVTQVVESALREVVGSTLLEPVLTTGRFTVANSTQDILQSVLDSYEVGVQITAVNLERAQPPEEVQAAFSDAIRAREDRERYINEAQAYSNTILPLARGDAQRAIEESEAYKARVEQAAIGESQRFLSLLSEFEKAPDVTRDRLYLETMESVLGNTSKVLMDSNSGNSLMYLPIDQLIGNRSGTPAKGTGMPSGSLPSPEHTASPAVPNTASDSAPRTTARSRDRGTVR